MAQRYTAGMSKNQKRKVRLGQRLDLAARDAEGHEEEEPVAQRAKPTRAPYLEEAGGSRLRVRQSSPPPGVSAAQWKRSLADLRSKHEAGAKSEPEEKDDEDSDEPDPAASASGGRVQLLSAKGLRGRGKGAKHWIEEGLRQKRSRAESTGSPGRGSVGLSGMACGLWLCWCGEPVWCCACG